MTFKTLEELAFSRDKLDFVFEQGTQLLTQPFDVVNLKRTFCSEQNGQFRESIDGYFKVDELLIPFIYDESDTYIRSDNKPNRKCHIKLRLDSNTYYNKNFPFAFNNTHHLDSIDKINHYIAKLSQVVPSYIAHHFFVIYNNFWQSSLDSLGHSCISYQSYQKEEKNSIVFDGIYYNRSSYKQGDSYIPSRIKVCYNSYNDGLSLDSNNLFPVKDEMEKSLRILIKTQYGFPIELIESIVMKDNYFSFDNFFNNFEQLKSLHEMCRI